MQTRIMSFFFTFTVHLQFKSQKLQIGHNLTSLFMVGQDEKIWPIADDVILGVNCSVRKLCKLIEIYSYLGGKFIKFLFNVFVH